MTNNIRESDIFLIMYTLMLNMQMRQRLRFDSLFSEIRTNTMYKSWQQMFPYVFKHIYYAQSFCISYNHIGVNITVSGVNSCILAPSRFPAFHLNCPAFSAYFGYGKNAHYALCSASSGTHTTLQPASSARQS